MVKGYIQVSKENPDIVIDINKDGTVKEAENTENYGYTSNDIKNAIEKILFGKGDTNDNQKKKIYQEGVGNFFNGETPECISKNNNQLQCYLKNGNLINFDLLGYEFLELSGNIIRIFLRMNSLEGENTIGEEIKIPELETKIKKLEELTKSGHWEFDVSKDELVGSHGLYNILGLNKDDFGNNYKDFLKHFFEKIHPLDKEMHKKALNNFLYNGGTYDITYRIILEDGSTKYIHGVGDIEFNSDGNHKHLIGQVQDITESKNLEKLLISSQKMEAIGTLAGGIAHDFNNILMAVIGYVELLLFEINDKKIRYYLEQVNKSALRAKDLVSQILLFSRQKEGKKEDIDIFNIIEEAIKIVKPTTPSTINIEENIKGELGTINADSTQIHQIIVNLCINANHAMEENGGTLKINAENCIIDNSDLEHNNITSGEYVKLSISDTGSGMKEEIKSKIFDPFFTTKEVGKGTGMGLSIVHGIVKNSGGEIIVESEEGKGTTINVLFPMIENKSNFIGLKNEINIPGGTENILLVDDELSILETIKEILENKGYSVTIASNGTQGYETFKSNPGIFDLVLTDLTMPGLTGNKLKDEILKIKPDIPVILMTGYNNFKMTIDNSKFEFSDYLDKPITSDILYKTVRDVMDNSLNKIVV